jgi:ankyrin repeat protein
MGNAASFLRSTSKSITDLLKTIEDGYEDEIIRIMCNRCTCEEITHDSRPLIALLKLRKFNLAGLLMARGSRIPPENIREVWSSAIGESNIKYVDFLIKSNVQIADFEHPGPDPLLCAVKTGNLEIVNKLLDYEPSRLFTPQSLIEAVTSRNIPIITALSARSTYPIDLYSAILEKNHLAEVEVILREREFRSDYLIRKVNSTPAITSEMAKLLLKYTQPTAPYYSLLLINTIRMGRADLTSQILSQTLDIPSESLNRALFNAVFFRQFGLSFRLIDRGADINALKGRVLKFFLTRLNIDAVKFMLICGASKNIGFIDMHSLAEKTGNSKMIELLKRDDLPRYPAPYAELEAEFGFAF